LLTFIFLSRRSLRKLRGALPATPSRRADVLHSYLHSSRIPLSPAVKTFHERVSKDNSTENRLESETLETINTFIQSVKHKRSDEARTKMKIIKSSVSGENIKGHGAATYLAKRLGIKPAAIKGGKRIRTEILRTTESTFEYTKRKTRSDAIDHNVKTKVFDFWLHGTISRPTNNKNDVKRAALAQRHIPPTQVTS